MCDNQFSMPDASVNSPAIVLVDLKVNGPNANRKSNIIGIKSKVVIGMNAL